MPGHRRGRAENTPRWWRGALEARDLMNLCSLLFDVASCAVMPLNSEKDMKIRYRFRRLQRSLSRRRYHGLVVTTAQRSSQANDEMLKY